MNKPKFQQTFCSQCGREFGPGDHGFSSCDSHRIKEAIDKGITNPQHETRHPYMGGYRAGWNDALSALIKTLTNESYSLGAVDGYDYNSGVEYGLRSAIIKAEKAMKA